MISNSPPRSYLGFVSGRRPGVLAAAGRPPRASSAARAGGGRELLLGDAVGMAEAATAADVDVELVITPGMFHVWPLFADLPEAEAAVGTIRSFISSIVSELGVAGH